MGCSAESARTRGHTEGRQIKSRPPASRSKKDTDTQAAVGKFRARITGLQRQEKRWGRQRAEGEGKGTRRFWFRSEKSGTPEAERVCFSWASDRRGSCRAGIVTLGCPRQYLRRQHRLLLGGFGRGYGFHACTCPSTVGPTPAQSAAQVHGSSGRQGRLNRMLRIAPGCLDRHDHSAPSSHALGPWAGPRVARPCEPVDRCVQKS